jgi:apolipoprotein D and lipocalin family protein
MQRPATVPSVDLQRFCGDWYVQSCIPTPFERGAHDAVETYSLLRDGSIGVEFTLRYGSFTARLRTFRPHGFVVPGTGNAEWRMQFVWPFKSEYLITHLAADYSETIISRTKRDFAWIMTRAPVLPEADHQRLAGVLAQQGYDLKKLVRVPQQVR